MTLDDLDEVLWHLENERTLLEEIRVLVQITNDQVNLNLDNSTQKTKVLLAIIDSYLESSFDCIDYSMSLLTSLTNNALLD